MFLKRSFRGWNGLSSFVISTLQWELGEGLERKVTEIIENNEAAVSWQISI